MFYCFRNLPLQLTTRIDVFLISSSPLMVNTQRLSSLAFSLCDGMKKEEKLSPMMKEKAIK